MNILFNTTRRDLKLFFKDKGMFFSSLITPIIMLVLYATFLANVYKDSFASIFPEGVAIPEKLLDGIVVSQLVSALMAVCCVTVSFCANLLMIQDKASGAIRDFTVSPVRRSVLAAGYYLASAISTLIIAFTALAVAFLYLALKGWYLSFADVLLVVLDVFLLTLFGTALSSCVNFFLTTSGQASAVGTVVSAGYGFICGAYMPIASFGDGLRKTLMFLPGTYGTCLIKNHMLRGALEELGKSVPDEVMRAIRKGIDCDLYFFEKQVPLGVMSAVLAGSVVFFTGLFVLFHILQKKKRPQGT